MAEEASHKPEHEPATSEFRFDAVLTAVSGINFLDTSGDREFYNQIEPMLRFATREKPLELFQLPRIADEVRPFVLAANPDIQALVADAPPEPPADCSEAEFEASQKEAQAWHRKVMEEHGNRMGDMVAISPIDPESHTHIPAGAEFQLMSSGQTIDSPERLAELLGKGAISAGTDIPTAQPEEPELVTAGTRLQQGDWVNQPFARRSPPPQLGFDQAGYEKALAKLSPWELSQQHPPHTLGPPPDNPGPHP